MSNQQIYTGKLHLVQETEQISDRFKKRVFIITDDHPEYPQFIPFELKQDGVTDIDRHQIGDTLTVS